MNMQPINKEQGDLMTVKDFESYVNAGAFIPYDGDGCWATETEYDSASNVWNFNKPDWATHVVWFNR